MPGTARSRAAVSAVRFEIVPPPRSCRPRPARSRTNSPIQRTACCSSGVAAPDLTATLTSWEAISASRDHADLEARPADPGEEARPRLRDRDVEQRRRRVEAEQRHRAGPTAAAPRAARARDRPPPAGRPARESNERQVSRISAAACSSTCSRSGRASGLLIGDPLRGDRAGAQRGERRRPHLRGDPRAHPLRRARARRARPSGGHRASSSACREPRCARHCGVSRRRASCRCTPIAARASPTSDRSGMRAAYEARLVIEPGAARLAAQRRPPEPLRAMRAALARQRRGARGRARAASRPTATSTSRSSPRPATRSSISSPACCGSRASARRSTRRRGRPPSAHAARRRRARGDPRGGRAGPRARRGDARAAPHRRGDRSLGALRAQRSSVTGFASSPTPPTRDLDDVALAQVARGLAAVADARRRPGGDHVARLERHAGREVDDQLDDREDQVARVGLLHDLAGDGRAQVDVLEVEPSACDHARPHRRERVEALAEGELAQRRLELRAAPADVVDRGDPADRRARARAGRAVGPPPDHDGDLALVVGARLLARDHDRLARADQRRAELREDDGHLRRIEVRLRGVRAVVEPDPHDLARDHRDAAASGSESGRAGPSAAGSAPSPRARERTPRARRARHQSPSHRRARRGEARRRARRSAQPSPIVLLLLGRRRPRSAGHAGVGSARRIASSIRSQRTAMAVGAPCSWLDSRRIRYRKSDGGGRCDGADTADRRPHGTGVPRRPLERRARDLARGREASPTRSSTSAAGRALALARVFDLQHEHAEEMLVRLARRSGAARSAPRT